MKKVLFVVAISSLFTGCASVGSAVRTAVERRFTSPIQLAQQDCAQMGFQVGTPQYHNCVLSVTNNIRNDRTAQAAASEAARMSVTPRTITCSRVGSYVNCTEY